MRIEILPTLRIKEILGGGIQASETEEYCHSKEFYFSAVMRQTFFKSKIRHNKIEHKFSSY